MSKYDEEIKKIITKAKIINSKIEEINGTYILSLHGSENILLIPSKVKNAHKCREYLVKLRGNLKVVGGAGLERTEHLFYDIKFNNIDFSKFDTSKVTSMSFMFSRCRVDNIDLSNFNTSKVTDMSHMFRECKVNSLDLSNFDTSQVKNMCGMFNGCVANSIDLSSFDTSKVVDMGSMFGECETDSLDLSNFDTSQVICMQKMFSDCKSEVIASDKRILQELSKCE